MEISKLFGLPAHPLLVHIPVVLVPLAALGAIVLVAVPRWRAQLRWLVLGVGVAGMLGTFLAAGSGEALQASVAKSQILEHHAELGDNAQVVVFLFVLALAAFVGWDWWRRRGGAGTDKVKPAVAKWVTVVLGVLTVVGAVAAGWMIVATGHNGAKATWHDVKVQGEGLAVPSTVSW